MSFPLLFNFLKFTLAYLKKISLEKSKIIQEILIINILEYSLNNYLSFLCGNGMVIFFVNNFA